MWNSFDAPIKTVALIKAPLRRCTRFISVFSDSKNTQAGRKEKISGTRGMFPPAR